MTVRNQTLDDLRRPYTGVTLSTAPSGARQAELSIYGEIGEQPALFGPPQGITARGVSEALNQAGPVDDIIVHISSPGGSVWEGMAIRTMLSQHPAKVTVDVEGLCASAATIIAMAGDHIRMHEGSSMMIHEGQRRTNGDMREHKRALSVLESVNDGAASVLAARTGKPKDDILQLMAAETWLTPDKALEMHLVDEVIKGKKMPAVRSDAVKSAPLTMQLLQQEFGYRNVPEDVVMMMLTDNAGHTGQRGTPVGTPSAQPSKDTEEETPQMSYARIAMALGLTGEALENENTVMSAAMQLQQRLQSHEVFLTELRTIMGHAAADSTEAVLGSLRGYIEAAQQVDALHETVAAQQSLIEATERNALLSADAVDPKGRKLTPAMVKLFEGKPVGELKAFLDVAPHLLQTQASNSAAPKREPMHTTNGLERGSTEEAALTYQGKRWEEMSAREKHNLHVDNVELYNQLREDVLRRMPRSRVVQG